MTLACARCHDHKYDPIPTADYYSLYGVFASSTEPAELPVIGKPPNPTLAAAFRAELKKRTGAREAYLTKTHGEIVDASRKHVGDYLLRVISSKPEDALAKLPFIKLRGDLLRNGILERWKRYLNSEPAKNNPVFKLWFAAANISADKFASEWPPALRRLEQDKEIHASPTNGRPQCKHPDARRYSSHLRHPRWLGFTKNDRRSIRKRGANQIVNCSMCC